MGIMSEWENKKYEKKAEWSERIALLVLGSLVVEQVIKGGGIKAPLVIFGFISAGLFYFNAERLLAKIK